MRVRLLTILAMLVCFVPFSGTAQAASSAASSKVKLLQKLRVSGNPKADAIAAAKSNPSMAGSLCVDLIFYRWITSNDVLGQQGSAPDAVTIDLSKLNLIIQGLASVRNPEVDWARMQIAPPSGIYGKPSQVPKRSEGIDLLNKARNAIILAASKRDSSPVNAVSHLTTANEVLVKRGLEISSAALLQERGVMRIEMGQYRQADEDDYGVAWRTYSDYELRAAAAGVREARGLLNMQRAMYIAAQSDFSYAADAWLKVGIGVKNVDFRNRASRMYILQGEAYAAMGKQESAVSAVALGIRDNGLPWAVEHKDYRMLVEDLLRAADVLTKADDRAGARDCLDLARKSPTTDIRKQAAVLSALASAWRDLGNNAKADETEKARSELITKAIAVGAAAAANKAVPGGASVPAGVLDDLALGAWACAEMKDYRQAAKYSELVVEAASRIGGWQKQVEALWAAATALQSVDSMKAIEYRKRAVSVAQSSKSPGPSLAIQILLDQAEKSQADREAVLKQAADLALNISKNQRDYALVQRELAKVYVRKQEYDLARRSLSDASQRYLSYVGDPWMYLELSVELADVQKALNDAEKEIAALTSGVSEAEKWWIGEGTESVDTPAHEKMLLDAYARLITLQVKNARTEDADLLLRRLAQRDWLDELAQVIPVSEGSVQDYLVEFRKGWTPPPTADSESLLAKNWAEVVNLYAQLLQSNPRMAESVPVSALLVHKLRPRIPAGLAVVSYIVGDKSTYAFVLGRDEAYCRQINIDQAKLGPEMRQLRDLLKANEERTRTGIPVEPVDSWQDEHVSEIMNTLEKLGSALITPIRRELQTANTLAFVLPQALDGAPVHAFVTREGDSPRFLVQDFAVCYATSGLFFVDMMTEPNLLTIGRDRVAVFANPTGTLERAEEEAERIREAFPECDVYVGSRATKDQFRKSAETASIIHIAQHYRGSAGGFTIDLASGIGGDGTLRLADVSDLKSPALSMVVLSGCETGGSANAISSSPLHASEIMSLAGASTVVGTLWKVSDSGCIEIMDEMYSKLHKATPKAEALRAAQVKMIESGRYAHPFYWAGFALFGNPN